MRAKIARYIACAISIPRTSSSVTEQTVMISVFQTSFHQVVDERTLT